MKQSFFSIALILVFFFCLFAQEKEERKEYYKHNRQFLDYNQPFNELNSPYNLKSNTNDVWTELNPKVPRVSYWCTDFVTAEIGWAVGEQGAIIKTTNGGNEWIDVSFNTSADLLRMDSYDGNIVIIAGEGGIILRSDDAGKTWEQISSGVTTQLWTVQMLNDSLGWICGPFGKLLKTTDSGITWEQKVITNYPDLDYWALDFYNYDIGFICCNGGQVLKTIDGGDNWELQVTSDSYGLYAITAIDSLRAVTGGNSGNIYYTTNGGNNWFLSANPLPLRVESISFLNDSVGFVVGNISGVVHKTTDGGLNWNYIRTSIGELYITFVNENLGYNVGLGLKVYRTTNQGITWNKQIFNNYLYDIYFTCQNEGWISAGPEFNGSNYPLLKTSDAGLNWHLWEHFPYDTLGGPIYTIKFINDKLGFMGASDNGIYKTTDGGLSWQIATVTGLLDTIGHINRFFFKDSISGWAVNSRGGILKTTDGGLNWFSQLNHLLATFFNSVNFKDSLNGWAVGTKSFQTTDGGESWVQKNEFDNQLIWDIYFLNDSTGWILGDSLSRTDDGGNTWYKVPNTPVSSGEFEWVDDEVGYITGGAFYKTTNGGNAWQHIPYESGKAFTRFSAPLKGFGFGVNGIGLIMKFDDRVTSIREESISFPETNILYQNYPNPFNTSTVIKYYLKNSGYVKLGIYNILGKEIIVLQDSYLNSGEYSARWDGKINYEFVASGVYIYRLVINNRKEVVTLNKKLLIIK